MYSDTSVAGAPAVQPPTGLAVSALAGNTVSLSGEAPLIGPAPTGYVLEGGVRPGEVLASHADRRHRRRSFTFLAPPGSVLHPPPHHGRRPPSAAPRAKSGSTWARRRGRRRRQSARPAYGSGPSVVLNVAQHVRRRRADGQRDRRHRTAPASPASRCRLSEHAGATTPCRPGTYGFTVRATNAGGTSGSSNTRDVDLPAAAAAARRPRPGRFVVPATGQRRVGVTGCAPTSGTTPTRTPVEARLRNAKTDDRARDVPGHRDAHFQPRRARPLQGAGPRRRTSAATAGTPAGRRVHACNRSRHGPLLTTSPARRNFLKMSARLAALGLTSLGVEPARRSSSATSRRGAASPTTRRSCACTCSAATTPTT